VNKKQLRIETISHLKKLADHPKKKQAKEEAIANLLLHSKLWQDAATVALYRSQNFEFNLAFLTSQALKQNKTVVVPKALPEGQMNFYEIDENTVYQKSTFGIEEPVNNAVVSKDQIHLLIVPGIVFSAKGYRIGFGGGYYDRFLTDFKGRSCSLVFSEQLNDNWEIGEFDLPVERIYTDHLERSDSYESL